MEKNNLPTNFLSYLESGGLKVTQNETPIIEFTSTNKSRIINIIDFPLKISGKPGIVKQLSEAKELAKNLKRKDITLIVKFKGDTVLKLGKDANPKLAKIVTLSNDIEISDLKKLKKLSEVF